MSPSETNRENTVIRLPVRMAIPILAISIPIRIGLIVLDRADMIM